MKNLLYNFILIYFYINLLFLWYLSQGTWLSMLKFSINHLKLFVNQVFSILCLIFIKYFTCFFTIFFLNYLSYAQDKTYLISSLIAQILFSLTNWLNYPSLDNLLIFCGRWTYVVYRQLALCITWPPSPAFINNSNLSVIT